MAAEMKKRTRDSESEVESDCEDSPEAKRIRSDLLEILDDADLAELEPAVDEAAQQLPDLALVMKSFEEEISLPYPPAAVESPGEELPEMGLGYLLEASDDELGLPPAISEEEENLKKEEEELPRVPSYGFGLDDDEQMWRFEDEMQNYDFGLLGSENSNNNGEFLALDGLFDHSDVYPVQSDFSDFFYRPESLSAL